VTAAVVQKNARIHCVIVGTEHEIGRPIAVRVHEERPCVPVRIIEVPQVRRQEVGPPREVTAAVVEQDLGRGVRAVRAEVADVQVDAAVVVHVRRSRRMAKP
jgi:hypothetical protein